MTLWAPAAVERIGDKIKAQAGAQKQLRGDVSAAGAEAIDHKVEALQLDSAVDLLAAIYDTHRTAFEDDYGKVVSQGLSDVFGEELHLTVTMGVTGDLPSVKFGIRNSRGLETGIIGEQGGGYAEIVAFLLQVKVLLSIQPPLARLLVLDEPFTAINEALYPRLAALLNRVIHEGGFQVILITQNSRLAEALQDIATTLHFRQDDGVTTFTTSDTSVPSLP